MFGELICSPCSYLRSVHPAGVAAETAPPFLNGDVKMLNEAGPTDAEVVAKSVEPSLCLVQVR